MVAYYEAMKADGWDSAPTYASEPESRHATLWKDGFSAHAKMRTKVGKWKYEAQISIWGPDGLHFRPWQEYSMERLIAAIRTCSMCGATDVETVRFSFAGRCCKPCLPEVKKKHEFPGWDR